MSDVDFRGLRDLLATAGNLGLPWGLDDTSCCIYTVDNMRQVAMVGIGGAEGTDDEARLIVAAVNSLPGLLERIDKLETGISKEVEGMREVAAIEIDHGSALHGHLLNEYAIQLDALLAPAESGGGET